MAAGTTNKGSSPSKATTKFPGADASAKKAKEEEAQRKIKELEKKKAEDKKKADEAAKKKADEKKRTDEQKAKTAKASAAEVAKKAVVEKIEKDKKQKQATDSDKKTSSGKTNGGKAQKNVKNEPNTPGSSSYVHSGKAGAVAANVTGPYASALEEQRKVKVDEEKKKAKPATATMGAAAQATSGAVAAAMVLAPSAGTGKTTLGPPVPGAPVPGTVAAMGAAAQVTSATAVAAMVPAPATAAGKTALGPLVPGAPTPGAAAAMGAAAQATSAETVDTMTQSYEEILKSIDENNIKSIIDSKKIVAKPPFSRPPQEKDKSRPPASSKIKTLKYSGLPNETPSILLNAEFLPIYDRGNLTRVGNILNQKENARILTSQNAITLLHGVDLKNSAIKSTQDSIKRTLPIVTDAFLNKIFPKFKELDAALNVNKPLRDKYPVQEDFPVEEEETGKAKKSSRTSFSNELARLGISLVGDWKYRDIRDYLIKKGVVTEQTIKTIPDTELWIMALEELKFSLSVSSVGTKNSEFNSVSTANSSKDNKKYVKSLQAGDSLWINNRIKLPDTYTNILTVNPKSKLSTKEDNSIYKSQVEEPLTKLFTFTSNQSIFIDRPIGGKNDTEIASAVNWGGTTNAALADAIPKAIGRISDVLQRERSYGKTIDNYSNALKIRGFEKSPDGMNISIWDHLVGVSPEKTFEMPENPIGKGYSLMSLAHEYASIGTDKYSVFTFERDNSPLGDSQSPKITTGREYYLETSLNINANGDAYDLSRINRLKKRFEDALETSKILEDFVNTYNDDLNNSQADNENFLPQYLNFKFHAISETYKKVLDISDKVNIKTVRSKFRDWTKTDNHNRFFAMLVKKIAGSMFQTDPQKGSLGRKGAVSFFVMCLCYCLDEGSITVDNFLYKNAVDNLMDSAASLGRSTNQFKSLDSFDDKSGADGSWAAGVDENVVFELETIKKEIFFEKSNILLRFLKVFKDEYSLYANLSNMQYSGADKHVYMIAYMINMMLVISCMSHENLGTVYSATKKNEKKSKTTSSFFKRFEQRIAEANNPQSSFQNTLAGFYKGTGASSEPDDSSFWDWGNTQDNNSNFGNANWAGSGASSDNDAGDSRANWNSNSTTPGPQKLDTVVVFTTSYFNIGDSNIDHSEIYDFTSNKNNIYNKSIFKSKTYMKWEMKELLSEVFMMKGFINHTLKTINGFIDLLSNNFAPYLAEVLPYFYENNNLTIDQKISLFNAANSEEQMVMSNYIYSEISDRINKEKTGENRLKNLIPSFKSEVMESLPFGSYLPVNDLEVCSFPVVKSYFNNEIFYKKDGNNKRIISVGVPPKMMRNLMSYDAQDFTPSESVKKNIVRIKIFKVDLLHRYLVFRPLSYLFDLNRFPTRVIGNWDETILNNGTNNPLEMPTKYWLGNGFELHAHAADPKVALKYGGFLGDSEQLEIYENHAKSFLAEEYIRWMTGVSIDETRYYNYEPMSKELSYLVEGYGKFATFAQASQGRPGANLATYTDPITGTVRTVPINGSQQEIAAAERAANQNSLPQIDVTSTLVSYLHNETFILKSAQLLKKAIYPKKFDRTFSIIFDPDDFIIDASSMEPGKQFSQLKPQIDSLKKEKFIVPYAPNSKTAPEKFYYKLRDITPGDVYMDEYFITIEPYLGIV